MQEENLGKLLNELAEHTTEPVRPTLADDIKQQIPTKLTRHRAGLDTINIIIHLRVNKLAAAAAIIITTILCLNFLGDRDTKGANIYQDSRILVKYILEGESIGRSDILERMSKLYEYLVKQDKEVVYYGGNIDPEDSNAVLMHWKLDDSNYRVIFGDSQTNIVSAEELIKLQARMLQKKTK